MENVKRWIWQKLCGGFVPYVIRNTNPVEAGEIIFCTNKKGDYERCRIIIFQDWNPRQDFFYEEIGFLIGNGRKDGKDENRKNTNKML